MSRKKTQAHPNSLQASEDPAIRARIEAGWKKYKRDARAFDHWAKAGFTSTAGYSSSPTLDEDDDWLVV